MEAIPIGAFWCIAIWTMFRQKQTLLYLLFATLPFGSMAAIPTAATGGLTLTPTTIVAMLLVARELGSMRGLRLAVDAAFKTSDLLLLFIFWVVAGVTTAFMPRFFAGQVQVVPVRFGDLADTVLLVPTTQNISQFVYVSISVLSVFSFANMLRGETMRRHALNALFLGAALMVFTGFLDFAAPYLHLEAGLEVFRTASYALLTEDEILSSKRVVGLMPEASVFGNLCLSFLTSMYFFRRAMPQGLVRDRGVPVLMALLLLLIWLSTSSAAYLGLGLFGAAATGEWCWRLLAEGRNPYLRRGLSKEFWFGAAGVGAVVLLFLAVPKLFTSMYELFDMMVLQKSSSSSFEERGMWTRVSWDALLTTHGLGVGLGGTRASNFAVALASNTGVLAATFYFLFVIQSMLLRRAAPGDAKGGAILSAIRWAYLPPFAVSLTIGTTPDFGLFNAFFYGLAAAVAGKGLQRVARPVIQRSSLFAMPREARAS
ncbi:MAG: hypothetical protein H7255_12765 [Ramlibacter sp.]|nr:hypothetical protein [Ramlibacter sp.]